MCAKFCLDGNGGACINGNFSRGIVFARMATISANNKRIAKNTLMLYARMALTMCIGFFTTRVLLDALGVEDYGLANVIGGVVGMFAFLSSVMRTACSRYLQFDMGRGDTVRLRQTFNLFQLIYFGLVVLFFVLGETVGLWFFETKIVIDPERLVAARWFFQFSLISFLLSTFSIPYSALVISHENMKAFSLITIFESAGRLGIVYLLWCSPLDHLAFYGALTATVSAIHLGIYFLVCGHNYPESKFGFYWNAGYFRELVSFGGWNLFGALTSVFSGVLVNVLLNNYFGAAVNAARSVAGQLSGKTAAFLTGFLTAANPQITKYYAAGDFRQAHLLTMRVSRFAFFLFLFVALPAFLLMPFVLNVWLTTVPEHAVWFARLTLIHGLVMSFSHPLMTLAQATGKIALYQSVVGGTLWLNLPVSWIALKFFGAPPESVVVVSIAIESVCLCLRLFTVGRCAKLSTSAFVKNVLVPAFVAGCAGAAVPVILAVFGFPEPSLTQFFVVGFASVFCCAPAFALLGFRRDERAAIFAFFKGKVSFFKSRRSVTPH